MVTNVREPFASTAFAGLSWSPLEEKAVDRVAASGKVDPLGLWLWKAKYQLESNAYKHAQAALAEIYAKRYTDAPPIAAAIVAQALREFLAPSCRDCRGVGEMLVNDLRVVCETCGGSKIHKYNDFERARTMQISYAMTKRSGFKITWLLGVMGQHDRTANAVMCRELERHTK
jgi:hypothetical protein